MTQTKNPTFTCAECRNTFIKARSDQDAAREFYETFPDIPLDDADLVCKGCFNRLHGIDQTHAHIH